MPAPLPFTARSAPLTLNRAWRAAWLLLASSAALAQGSSAGLSLSLSSERFNDATRLSQMGREGAPALQPRAGDNLAYEENEVRLAWDQGPWRLSALGRQSASIVAGASGLQLAQGLIERRKPGQDQDYRVDLSYRGFSGLGLALARRWGEAGLGSQGWQGQLELQALQLRRLRETEIHGTARYQTSSQSYAFDLQGLRVQDTLRFPFQQDHPRQGWGLLAQAELGWCQAGALPWCLSLRGENLGQLRWRQMPQEWLQLSTQTQSYDEDGYLIYKPMLSGRYSQTAYRQQARQRWTLQAQGETDWGRAQLRLIRLQGYGPLLPELGMDWTAANEGWSQSLGLQRWGLHWATHERRLSLRLQGTHWQMALGGDRPGAGARAREVSLAWHQPF
ncbi:hypothetical protein [Kinneretia aquatilis]|uniref:hypothetical protein n=1 Tax=Kinneretia aquatilis TaxID=2070761 RepID=UPI000C9AAD34|nr:hypothetical protein [Paucibacter aquatile]